MAVWHDVYVEVVMPAGPFSFLKDAKGSIAVVYCASASVILAVVALAVTLGDASIIRNRTQDALDSAVLAAASMGYGTTDADRIAFAQKLYDGRRSERGDGALQIVVRNLPPGTFKTSDTMVFGDVQLAMNSPFLGALDMPIIDIGVSSAARKSRSGVPVCVLGLDPTESATMDFNGQASLTVDNCATQANSTDGEGLHQVGHPSMSAKEIGVTGGFTGSAYAPAPITGTTPLPDPYASLTEPPSGHCHSMSGAKLQQQTLTLTPGTYCGGLDIKAGSIITLDPGIYIFQDGPLNIDSQSTVQGSEVMLAFLGSTSTLYLVGGASLTVTSPMSGPYENIQFFGDRNVYPGPGNSGSDNLWFTVIGDSTLNYDGALYTPSFHVWFAGGSIIDGRSPNNVAVAKKLWFQDHTQVHFTQVNSRGMTEEPPLQLQYGATLFK